MDYCVGGHKTDPNDVQLLLADINVFIIIIIINNNNLFWGRTYC
jgi:hypothetical protein